jgi:hypothetical protein
VCDRSADPSQHDKPRTVKVPEWRRRAEEATAKYGRVAVVSTVAFGQYRETDARAYSM